MICVRWLDLNQWRYRCQMVREMTDDPTLKLLMVANLQEMDKEIEREDRNWREAIEKDGYRLVL